MSVDPPDTNGAAANGFTNGQSSGKLPEPRPSRGIMVGSNHKAAERPSIQVRVKTIETLLKASKELPLRDGDKAYLVSRSWVDKALTLGADSKLATEATDAEVLGPVDNADIIEEILIDSSGFEYIRLKPGSGLESFELFTEDCWNLVIGWYGLKDGQKPIVRSVINSAPDPQSEAEYMYELHLPIFRVHRLWSEISPLPIEQTLKAKNPPPLTLVRSRKAHAQTFLKDIKTLAGIPFERKVRVFSVPQILPAAEPVQQSLANALTPPDSPEREGANGAQDPWAHLLLSTVAFADTKDVRIKVPIEDHTGNEKYNGSTTLRVFDLVTDQTLVVDESIDKFWVSTYDGKKAARITSVKDTASGLSSKTNSRRNSPNPQGPITRGRGQQKRGRSLGAVGLHNLGNTCYMNSALQCVRSVEELTKYFLTDSYIDEINKGNPLGYNGRVATAYVSLLKEIYAEGRGSVSPREFKTTVGRCRSTFQGWGQQDSQEFLGFLLDGLQEDLSRIKKKPYIEKPDSTDDMINDPEAIRKMAEEVWDITRRRDDSVIADLFTGMYKSTLKCPVCGKISITFDPFNNLTLPLPVEDMWIKTVKFFPLNDVPVKIEVELPKHSALEQLKQFVSDRTGVPLERLMGAEEFKDRFFKIYDNNHDISEEIQSSDIPTIHELESVPTNWPSAPRRKKYRSMLDVDTPLEVTEWDDPKYERMVVPVFHRRPNLSRGSDNASPPHFIMLTKEEASNYDLIVRKVLERVATFSSWSKLAEAAEPDNTNNGDSDVVIVASDADSSGDSKVAADSVKGEEDLVDVTMKDASDKPATLPPQSKILKQFNTKRPAFANPEVPIHPELQSLFDLSYFTDSSEGTVPTGWSQVDNTRQLPKLSDRIQSAAEEDEPSPGESWGSTASGDGESSNEDAPKVDAEQTRMLDESSEEDDSTAARVSPCFCV
jgi:ubiquitin carboxyl-terminal hydrolase 4/11/15